MRPPSANFFEMLRILTGHHVDFIVVGGVCGALYGAPMTTIVLEILRSIEPGNSEKFLMPLDELEGYGREHNKNIKPNLYHLEANGHLLLRTRYSPLDILSTIGKNHRYDDFVTDTTIGTVRGFEFRMLKLETLILTKEELGRKKDKAMLSILRETLVSRK